MELAKVDQRRDWPVLLNRVVLKAIQAWVYYFIVPLYANILVREEKIIIHKLHGKCIVKIRVLLLFVP